MNNHDSSFASPYPWRPRHISLLSIVLALITLVSFFVIVSQDAPSGFEYKHGFSIADSFEDVPPPAIPTETSESVYYSDGYNPMPPVNIEAESALTKQYAGIAGISDSISYNTPPNDPYYSGLSGNVPVIDVRELLKVDYRASMRARNVSELTRRVEMTVRGQSGRIDQMESSPKSGYLSFVLPISKFDAFRIELESLVKGEFLVIDILSSNMLPEKRGIEEQQKYADKMLAEYQASRFKVVEKHASTVKLLQSQISAANTSVADLRAKTSTVDLRLQIRDLMDEVSLLKAQLAYENNIYTSLIENFDNNIKYVQELQTAVKTQDQNLLDNVATVNGSVSIEWISLWDIVHMYLPGYWISAIFALLTILSLLYDGRRFGTVS